MADSGIALIGLALLYLLSKKKTGITIGNGNGFVYQGSGNGSMTVEEQDPDVEEAIVKPRLSLTTWKKTSFVSKATGEISPGTYTRPAHIPRAISKRAELWIR